MSDEKPPISGTSGLNAVLNAYQKYAAVALRPTLFFDAFGPPRERPYGPSTPRPRTTVGELIAQLQQFDPDLPVVSPFGEMSDLEDVLWVGEGETHDWDWPIKYHHKRRVVIISDSDESWRNRD